MKKLLITWIIALATQLLKHKKYRTALKKVNLACGLTCAQGWFNIDGSLSALLGSKQFTWWNKLIYKLAGSAKFYTFAEFNEVIRKKRTYFYDLRYGIPLNDNSVQILYCSHFLEHLNKPDGARFIAECYRVLAKGGLMRLVLPDLDIAIKQFQTKPAEKVLDLFFYTSDYADFAAHKYNYNFKLLATLLKKVGFKNIERQKYRQGQCPDLKLLDSYPDHSLYLECRK